MYTRREEGERRKEGEGRRERGGRGEEGGGREEEGERRNGKNEAGKMLMHEGLVQDVCTV